MARAKRSVPPAQQVLADHLRELRNRLTWVGLTLLAGGIGCYLVYAQVFALLQAPLSEQLYFTTPAGGFTVLVGICLAAGAVLAIPVLVYQLLMFLAPASKGRIRRAPTIVISLIAFALSVAGAAFALGVVLPVILKFFTGFQTESLDALIGASSYFELVGRLLVTFAVIFQLPLLLWTANRIRPLPPRLLIKAEKWVVLGSLVAAFMVPFALDLTTQFFIALPIVLLYNLSILIVLIDQRLRRPARAKRRHKDAAVVSTTSVAQPDQFDEVVQFLAGRTSAQGSRVDGVQARSKKPSSAPHLHARPRGVVGSQSMGVAPVVNRSVSRSRLISDFAPQNPIDTHMTTIHNTAQ